MFGNLIDVNFLIFCMPWDPDNRKARVKQKQPGDCPTYCFCLVKRLAYCLFPTSMQVVVAESQAW